MNPLFCLSNPQSHRRLSGAVDPLPRLNSLIDFFGRSPHPRPLPLYRLLDPWRTLSVSNSQTIRFNLHNILHWVLFAPTSIPPGGLRPALIVSSCICRGGASQCGLYCGFCTERGTSPVLTRLGTIFTYSTFCRLILFSMMILFLAGTSCPPSARGPVPSLSPSPFGHPVPYSLCVIIIPCSFLCSANHSSLRVPPLPLFWCIVDPSF